MQTGFLGFFVGEAEYFGKILPADATLFFDGGGVGRIADVAHAYDPVLIHLLLGLLDFLLDDGRIKSSFGNDRAEEFDESGMGRNDVFQVT